MSTTAHVDRERLEWDGSRPSELDAMGCPDPDRCMSHDQRCLHKPLY